MSLRTSSIGFALLAAFSARSAFAQTPASGAVSVPQSVCAAERQFASVAGNVLIDDMHERLTAYESRTLSSHDTLVLRQQIAALRAELFAVPSSYADEADEALVRLRHDEIADVMQAALTEAGFVGKTSRWNFVYHPGMFDNESAGRLAQEMAPQSVPTFAPVP